MSRNRTSNILVTGGVVATFPAVMIFAELTTNLLTNILSETLVEKFDSILLVTIAEFLLIVIIVVTFLYWWKEQKRTYDRKIQELNKSLERLEGKAQDIAWDTHVWDRQLSDAQQMRLLASDRNTSDRNTKFVSFINLKGGVGKTTISSNLAATLALMDKRVLVVDIDFQYTLSERVVPKDIRDHVIKGGHTSRKLLQKIDPNELKNSLIVKLDNIKNLHVLF